MDEIEALQKHVDTLADVVRRFMRAADDHGHVNEPALRAAYRRGAEALLQLRTT